MVVGANDYVVTFGFKASHCSGYVSLLGETSLSLGMGLAGIDLIAFSL